MTQLFLAFLCCRLDDVFILLQFGGHGHVHKPVANGDHHATHNGGVHRVRDEALLARLHEGSDGALNLLLHASIKRLK